MLIDNRFWKFVFRLRLIAIQLQVIYNLLSVGFLFYIQVTDTIFA